jgi:hypothetical protein
MSSSSESLPVFEKLNFSDNYNKLKYLMELYLVHEDLWECVALATTAASGSSGYQGPKGKSQDMFAS